MRVLKIKQRKPQQIQSNFQNTISRKIPTINTGTAGIFSFTRDLSFTIVSFISDTFLGFTDSLTNSTNSTTHSLIFIVPFMKREETLRRSESSFRWFYSTVQGIELFCSFKNLSTRLLEIFSEEIIRVHLILHVS